MELGKRLNFNVLGTFSFSIRPEILIYSRFEAEWEKSISIHNLQKNECNSQVSPTLEQTYPICLNWTNKITCTFPKLEYKY